MRPYMDRENSPELFEMCTGCEAWCGDTHDYTECEGKACFRNWLAYAYLKWATSWE